MSFQEVKSMLRMINIHMDDGYAYKLFKVPTLHPVTCCPQERTLGPSLPSQAHRTVRLVTPKATYHDHQQWLDLPVTDRPSTTNGWIHHQWLDLSLVVGYTTNDWIYHHWLDPPPLVGPITNDWIHHQWLDLIMSSCVVG